MCSLVMSPFSHDYMKTKIDQLKYQQCFDWFTCEQNSHSAWFLDGKTSILVINGCISHLQKLLKEPSLTKYMHVNMYIMKYDSGTDLFSYGFHKNAFMQPP